MKKILSLFLTVILLLSIIPSIALGDISFLSENLATYTELSYKTRQKVSAIDAIYFVESENVKEISVEFNSSCSYAYSNFENGKITFCIIALNGIDMTDYVARITATLTDNSVIAPTLKKEVLLFNGSVPTEDFKVKSCELSNNEITLKLYSEYLNNSYVLIASSYKENGQLVEIKYLEFTADEKEETISLALSDTDKADKVKLVMLTDNFVPLVGAFEFSLIH